MATSRLISGHLRRTHFSLLRPFLLSLSSSPNPSPPLPTTFDHISSLFSPSTTSFRYFSSRPSDLDFTHQLNSVTESELRRLGFIDGSHISDVVNRLLDDSALPIRYFVSVLDGFHDLTGLPWWIVIASSTVAMRITLFPWIVLQLHKMKQIGEMLPKLPRPIPLPFSGRSYVDQFSHFRRERQALGCPTYLWFLASFTVQLPCFILWMASIRRMSLDQYPGFDTEGILWFQNLTEVPNGPFGPILPLLIAGLHFCNIQINFRSSFASEEKGLLQSLAKLYKRYLEVLTLPMLFVGFHMPQGSLVYWVTNSSLSLIQNLCLQNPTIRQRLGAPLPSKGENVDVDHEKNVSGSALLDALKEHGHVSAFNLSSEQLVNLSVSYLCAGRVNRALPLLRLALDKDPECYSALTVMGQTMLQLKDYENAAEYLESAISKISLAKPTDAESIDFLIQASMSAAAAYYRQGKVAESFAHFERMKDIEVPEEAVVVKERYYEGIMCFASFLLNEGHKEESAKYLRMACAYDSKYSFYLEKLEKDINKGDNFVADLSDSRRADY
ncbi:ALBINO3-like protein 2, chloroplastic [Chenopodium quinoa]|uniref:ALBINO3-like protein 2, chloroplastic n=1 Tax=Chenopodium quinoa TaxID=63459 RepID=UPI000B776048|nr:ALBINO3-like protein 2, chloroplastic [Chenopodium quinoa]